MPPLDTGIIQARLGLLPRRATGTATARCEDYLLDRPLTVEPIVALVLEAGDAPAAGRRATIDTLSYFRASVRALDDLLDASPTDPTGRAAAWTSFGHDTAIHAALALWERAVAVAPEAARAGVLHESACLLEAAALEAEVTSAAPHARWSLARLAALEHRIREKERGYWRLIARVVAPHWRASPVRFARAARLLVGLGDQWQRADDVRDLDEDIRGRRISSFIVDLLRSEAADGACDPSLGPSPSLAMRLESLERHGGAWIAQRQSARSGRLVKEERALRDALANALDMRESW